MEPINRESLPQGLQLKFHPDEPQLFEVTVVYSFAEWLEPATIVSFTNRLPEDDPEAFELMMDGIDKEMSRMAMQRSVDEAIQEDQEGWEH